MGLESATYIDDLVATNPTTSDPVNAGDDHLRLLKSVLQSSFPNVDGAVTSSVAELNDCGQLRTDLTAAEADIDELEDTKTIGGWTAGATGTFTGTTGISCVRDSTGDWTYTLPASASGNGWVATVSDRRDSGLFSILRTVTVSVTSIRVEARVIASSADIDIDHNIIFFPIP